MMSMKKSFMMKMTNMMGKMTTMIGTRMIMKKMK